MTIQMNYLRRGWLVKDLSKIIFVQEVKQQSIVNIATDYLKNFQLFELVRKEQRVSGGGLMIGVDKELKALQVREGDDDV